METPAKKIRSMASEDGCFTSIDITKEVLRLVLHVHQIQNNQQKCREEAAIFTQLRSVCKLWRTVAEEIFRFERIGPLNFAIQKDDTEALRFLAPRFDMTKSAQWATVKGSEKCLDALINVYKVPLPDDYAVYQALINGHKRVLSVLERHPDMKEDTKKYIERNRHATKNNVGLPSFN